MDYGFENYENSLEHYQIPGKHDYFRAGVIAGMERAAGIAERWRGSDGVSCGCRLYIAEDIRKEILK